MTTPAGSAPAVPPVTEALRAGSRCIPAFTHPTHAPDTWHQWQQTTGRHLAATGLPVRLNPGHRSSLTIPGGAGNQAGGENAGPNSSSPTPSSRLP
ncbi:hypothetical protein RM550_22005 [Streptomyces sp. DSM 41527]|uniref:Uncharacterized protein n=1 Tax=Streptomyces mooreae TaxID=3075523 RepID=A0ABU2TBX1_9ACTN|nr:hypothetical protein [Streptomyces sp. DSM 41527]MDT0458380.1 hypothetical protein [Streptomyces sp. DSM 41527]